MEIILVLGAVMAAFYFILLRPVIRQQRQQRRDISSLEIGDEVLTTGGFYAVVNEINTFEDRPMEIVLEAAPGVLLRGTTAAITLIARRRLHDEEPGPDEVDEAADAEEWEDEEEDVDDEEWDDEEEDVEDVDDDEEDKDVDDVDDVDDDEDDEDDEDDDIDDVDDDDVDDDDVDDEEWDDEEEDDDIEDRLPLRSVAVAQLRS